MIVNDSRSFINVLDMQSNYRVAETANKDVIILNVTCPMGLTYADPKRCIEKLDEFTVDEFLPKRFQPHQGTIAVPSTSEKWKKMKMSKSSNKQ